MLEKIPDTLNLVGAVIISVISSIAAITRRIAKGEKNSIVWFISEFLTAILCGFMMYSAYPAIQPSVPGWFTMPVAVAIASHVGGRIFQEAEQEMLRRFRKFFKIKEV